MFSLQGKVSRSIYWTTTLLNIFVILVIVLLNIGLYKGLEGIPAVSPDLFRILLLISLIPAFPALWFIIAVTVKRFHDRNKSGWWILIALTGVGILWILVECGFMKGVDASTQSTSPVEPITQTLNTNPIPIPPLNQTENPPTSVPEPISQSIPQTPEASVQVPQPIPQVTVMPPAPLVEKTQGVESSATPFPPSSVVSHTVSVSETTVSKDIKEDTQVEQISVASNVPVKKAPETPAPSIVENKIVQPQIPLAPQTEAPYTIPPVRSMAEMLAELDRLSKQAPVKQVPQVKKETKEDVKIVPTPTPTLVQKNVAVETYPEQKSVSTQTTTVEDIPAPETKEDLTSALNDILAEAEKSTEIEEKIEEVQTPVSKTI